MRRDKVQAGQGAEYVSQTQQRIAQITQALARLRHEVPDDLRGVMGQIREQEAASQAARFAGIAELACNMRDCLEWAAGTHCPLQSVTVEALLDACHCIILHTEAVAAGLLAPSHHHPPRRPAEVCGASQLPEHTDDQTGTPSEVHLRRRSRRPRTAAGKEAIPAEACPGGDCSYGGAEKATCGSEQVPNRPNVVRVNGEIV